MAISLTHAFVSGKSDGADSTLVQPSNWNDQHTLTCASGVILGRSTAGAGEVEEITVTGNFAFDGGTLTFANPVSALTVTTLSVTNLTVDGVDISAGIAGKADITGDTFTGSVTIQSTAPSFFLDETDGTRYRFYASSNLLRFYNQDTGTTLGYFDSDGDFRATRNITAYSDERLKENVEVIPHALQKVCFMNGVTFNRIGEDVRSTGVIAQNVQGVLPEAVEEGENGMLTVAYGNMVGVLIEAIKELRDTVDFLESRVQELESR